jgi:uncharacterized protein DUF4236
MGLRFRRYVRILPRVRLNVGLKSVSVSLGGRGFHYTMGAKGRRVTAGIPGTGLSWTEYTPQKTWRVSVATKRAVIITFLILATTAFAIWAASTLWNTASNSTPENDNVAIGMSMYGWEATGMNSVVDILIPLPRPRPKIDAAQSLREPLKLH